MKKILFLAVLVSLAASHAFGQGTVNWVLNPAAITIQTNTTQFSPTTGGGATGFGSIGDAQGSIAAGTGFYVSLVYQPFTGVQASQPTTIAQLSTWSDSGLWGTNSPSNPGRLVAANQNTAAVVPWNSGTTDSIMVVAWSQNLGTTFATALASIQNGNYFGNGFFGESATGYVNPHASDVNPGAILFGSAATVDGLPIYSPNTQLYLTPVPEPTTLALAAVAGLAILVRRRR